MTKPAPGIYKAYEPVIVDCPILGKLRARMRDRPLHPKSRSPSHQVKVETATRRVKGILVVAIPIRKPRHRVFWVQAFFYPDPGKKL